MSITTGNTEDLEVQRVMDTFKLNHGEVSGLDAWVSTSGNIEQNVFPQASVIKPLGGLDRGEAARLKGFEFALDIMNHAGDSASAMEINGRSHWTFDPETTLIDHSQDSIEQLNAGFQRHQQELPDDPDTVTSAPFWSASGMVDDTNGNATPSNPWHNVREVGDLTTPYSSDFTVDRHDVLYNHFVLGIQKLGGNTSCQWTFEQEMTLYWEPFEE